MARTPLSRLGAALRIPSLSDFLFVALLGWLFLSDAGGWSGLLVDGDTGWHIRTGEFILDHGSAPTRDLFSFSKAGQPWFAWEWLADTLYALLHRTAGLKGIVLLSAVVIVAGALVVFRHALWRGSNALVALGVALLGVGASSVHHLARPHVFTLLLMAVALFLLDRDRRSPTRAVWLLAPLTALWINLHGGFVGLVATLVVFAAAAAAEALLEREARPARWRQARRYSLLAAACAAASLANPYGFRLHLHIAAYLRSDWIKNAVEEFQSPSFRNENMLQFEILLLAGLMVATLLAGRRRLVEAAAILFWAHAALVSVRHVPVYAVVAVPIISAELSALWSRACAGLSRRNPFAILHAVGEDVAAGFRRTTIWAAVPVAALAALNGPIHWPRDFPTERFPTALVERHAERLSQGRVFTSDQWADYLIYRFYPRQRVFFDGRSDFYGAELGREYLALVQGKHNWESVLERYGFDTVLGKTEWPLATLLKTRPGWKILADDGKAILFVRSTQVNTRVLDQK